MTRQDLNALLMKIQTTFDTSSKINDYSKRDVYFMTRTFIDFIEEANKKQIKVKRNFELIQGLKDEKTESP